MYVQLQLLLQDANAINADGDAIDVACLPAVYLPQTQAHELVHSRHTATAASERVWKLQTELSSAEYYPVRTPLPGEWV